MRSAITSAFDGPEGELCEKAMGVTEGDTWEWFGVKVPVVRDTWDADVLALAVEMLLKKSSQGLDVGLILCEPEQEIGLFLWIKPFEALHSLIPFGRTAYTTKHSDDIGAGWTSFPSPSVTPAQPSTKPRPTSRPHYHKSAPLSPP